MALLAFDGFASDILIVGPSGGSGIEQRFKASFADSKPVSVRLGESPLISAPCPNDRSDQTPLITNWIIPTSGTTGEPKLIKHSLQTLSATVRRDSAKGQDLVWGMIYDAGRFAGIQVMLQAFIGASKLAIPANSTDLEDVALEFASAGVNALSATPSMWRRMIMAGVLDSLKLKIATLGGETADNLILTDLSRRFPSARITHIYASTEAGVGFSVTDGLAGFPNSYVTEGTPNGTSLRVGPEGSLFIRKQISLAPRLLEAPSLARKPNEWIDTGDLVEKRGDRYYFLGRSNGTINVGGRKVQPTEIEQVIQSIPGVAMVAVTDRKNPFLGSVVEAWVVPTADTEHRTLRTKIIAHCSANLESHKVPASVKIVEEIPLNETGKIRRS